LTTALSKKEATALSKKEEVSNTTRRVINFSA
jgi:hypothetical protein